MNYKRNSRKCALPGVSFALSLSAAGGKALTAVYGTILFRLERNLSGLSAFRAHGVIHLTLTAGSTAGLARLTAGLAAGGLVLESFFGIEFLFTGSENELSATVFAYQRFVFVHGLVTPIKYDRRFLRLTWSLTPHTPPGSLLCASRTLTRFSRDPVPDGLTSRPHHAPRRFGRITWTALPATGIGLQPQTRRTQPATLYYPLVKNARNISIFDKKDISSVPKVGNPLAFLTSSGRNRRSARACA